MTNFGPSLAPTNSSRYCQVRLYLRGDLLRVQREPDVHHRGLPLPQLYHQPHHLQRHLRQVQEGVQGDALHSIKMLQVGRIYKLTEPVSSIQQIFSNHPSMQRQS